MSQLNNRVYQYAKLQLGKRVYTPTTGNQKSLGECWDFAEMALSKAGAMTSNDIMVSVTSHGEYKWGNPISLQNAKAGDILQFKRYACEEKITNKKSGEWKTNTTNARHHTAIIMHGQENGAARCFHQNFKQKKTVHRTTFQLHSAKYEKNGLEYEYKVTGTISAYRPMTRRGR